MSLWFKTITENIDSKLRFFCFPYAGGSAHVFSNWSKKFSSDIDVFALQSPGRGVRFSEEPISCLKTKLSILEEEIKPYLDKPCIFVGHSNGALLAFELARKIDSYKKGVIQHLILSAKRPPHLESKNKGIHKLPQQQFIEKLKDYKFTPDEILNNEELMEVFTPMLRADFALSETLSFDSSLQMDISTTIFWGNEDLDTPIEDLKKWKDLISKELNYFEFSGGHFFINTHEDEFLNKVNKIVEEVKKSYEGLLFNSNLVSFYR